VSKAKKRHDATPRMKDIPTTTRPIYLQRVTGELAVETLYKETDVSWVCGNNGDYHLRKDVWSEISELDYKALLEIRGEDTATKKLRPIYLLRHATGEVLADVLFGETEDAWILGRKGVNSIPKKGWVEMSEDGYHAMLEDVPEDDPCDPCECGFVGCKRCRPEEDDEIFYPNTYRVTLDITTRQAVSLQDVARLLDTKKIATPFVGAEVVSIARRE
jgi:hypothetical protein